MAKIRGTVSLMQEVLSQTSREDLHSFFHRYLRHDVRAQLQFLARFSDKIDVEESLKYEWLFYKSLQLLRGSSTHLGISKQKELISIYKELHGQAADALAINHYVKTFYIVRYGLSFLRLLHKKERTMHKGFQEVFDQYIKLLYQLYEADLPRDLIHLMIPFVEQEITLSEHTFVQKYYTYLRLKIRLEYDQNGMNALISYIDEHWSYDSLMSSEKLTTFFYTLFTEPWASIHISSLASIKIQREVWRKVLNKMKNESYTEEVKEIWSVFNMDVMFSEKKYQPFVRQMRPKLRRIRGSKTINSV